ncbi:MAG: hypothetical protein EBU66_18850 [Bacteroidetes bacterium]|nr:hypothetical protein [bacterium]NBP66692.1 hypothetical protein [Bacteroidota bacterium]
MRDDTIKDVSTKVVIVGKIKMTIFSFMMVLFGISMGLATAVMYHPVIGLLITGGFFLVAYNINCVVVGKCYAWAWVLFVIYVIYTISLLMTMFGIKYMIK